MMTDPTEFEAWSCTQLLEWTVERFFPRVTLTCSLSVEDVALAHMLRNIEPRAPIVFIDTGFHFAETLELRNRLVELGWSFTVYSPADQEQTGVLPDPEHASADLCCHVRKVEPMIRALDNVDAWITGLRRAQSETRQNIGKVENHVLADGRAILKLSPLAEWTADDVWEYARANGLPYNVLYDLGYTSIGCEPCTQPVGLGEHERSGRWRGLGKTECGLHTFTNKTTD